MTRDEAAAEVYAEVYGATRLLEDLEHEGKVRGNGHHMRQAAAQHAADLLKSRWVEGEPTGQAHG